MTLTTAARDTMADFDIAPGTPLRIGIGGIGVDDDLWLDSPGEIVRVGAADLRDLAHKAAAARAERPGVAVLADIDVMIAGDAQSARDAMAAAGLATASGRLLYVGTPAGLAGLIMDIHALGMADGAVLIPLAGDVVLRLIREEVLPELLSLGAPVAGARESKSA